jgi:hypothetical protein
MNKFTLTIHTDNDAFANGNEAHEIERILHKIIPLVHTRTFGVIYDVNGNYCGQWNLQ